MHYLSAIPARYLFIRKCDSNTRNPGYLSLGSSLGSQPSDSPFYRRKIALSHSAIPARHLFFLIQIIGVFSEHLFSIFLNTTTLSQQ